MDRLRETASAWSPQDAAALALMAGVGCDMAAIARALHRTQEECERKARTIEGSINGKQY